LLTHSDDEPTAAFEKSNWLAEKASSPLTGFSTRPHIDVNDDAILLSGRRDFPPDSGDAIAAAEDHRSSVAY